MQKTIVLPVPEEIVIDVQRADVERSSRRDILIYLMEHPEINVSEERRNKYQAEYDEKYKNFEQAKINFEHNFVQPAVNNQGISWNLDYNTKEVTITFEDNE